MLRPCLLPALLACLLLALPATAQDDEAAVTSTLDAVHRLASEADFEGYFDLYTDDAIFLGTDATERWTIADFKQYARPAFDRGTGWTYVMTERHVSVSADGNTAWFDERLENAAFGECRGSGVLVKQDGVWKVAQYNLTVPIPNDLLRNVAGQIRAHHDNN
ncbi:MAG: nuclear transport factor 2 family protein [Bacteroidetes bacterium]|nr:nuclear transport factor 2 family protein [Bacteroidota bacterium]MDA0875350.1 nuclear transport factor 2 family protein [Bacteroidota bacterium]